MVEYYWRQASNLPALSGLNREQFIQYFDLMGLQRHLKVLGIFCRLHYRDGKSAYLADLPRVLHHAIEAAERYPATQAFGQWLSTQIAPRLTLQNTSLCAPGRTVN
jgi:aminoglycoside/choline kinase family phosphotransferase